MELIIKSSSSKGNAYILRNGDEALLLECGIHFSEIKKSLDFQLSSIVGACITHEHRDHSKYIKEYMSAGVTVLAGKEVFESHNISTDHFRAKVIYPDKGYKLGNFKIVTFGLFHDCRCLGFHISHPETGSILFITDTFMVEHQFENISTAIVECNYSDDILSKNIDAGRIPMIMKQRLMSTHMSLGTCKCFLRSIAGPQLQNIILVHLSDGNSDENMFVTEITKEFGISTIAGDKEQSINLDLIPY